MTAWGITWYQVGFLALLSLLYLYVAARLVTRAVRRTINNENGDL